MDSHEGAVQQTSVTAFVAVGTPSRGDAKPEGRRDGWKPEGRNGRRREPDGTAAECSGGKPVSVMGRCKRKKRLIQGTSKATEEILKNFSSALLLGHGMIFHVPSLNQPLFSLTSSESLQMVFLRCTLRPSHPVRGAARSVLPASIHPAVPPAWLGTGLVWDLGFKVRGEGIFENALRGDVNVVK